MILTKQNCNIITKDSITITVKNDCIPKPLIESEIPNVFTPNGDGINDVWQFTLPKGSTLSGVEVYNRWGINLTPALSEGEGVVPSPRVLRWDGRTTSGEACSDGVYYYTLTYKLVNGDVITKKGFISLIR